MHEAAGRSPESTGDATSTAPAPADDGERILLLECRLEQLRSALDQARAEADGVRVKLAEAAAREADHARRHSLLHHELAEARAELASLHERLDRSEALRAELEGHLFEAGARGDAAELVRLRREVLAQRQRSIVSERTCARLRARVDELLLSRATLLTRMAEWQRLVQKEGPAAADLAEFMAELRRDILHLEHRNAAGERQEAALRHRLVRAGLDPDAPAVDEPTDAARAAEPAASLGDEQADVSEPAAAARPATADATNGLEPVVEVVSMETEDAEVADLFSGPFPASGEEDDVPDSPERAEAGKEVHEPPLSPDRAGAAPRVPAWREGTEATPARAIEVADAIGADAEATTVSLDEAAAAAPEPETLLRAAADPPPVEGLDAEDASVRAAAYERLIRTLEDDPARLARHLRPGLADPHPRVRRRAVLAAATAQRLPVRALIEPLRSDPDPHVRHVVREVLRHARAAEIRTENEDEAVLVSTQVAPGTRS